jgi:hypothetical protein
MTSIQLVKTNHRRGGYVRNIHVSNITAKKIAGGVLCVDTDVLYQWRDLVPTYERRLTPIEGLYVSNIAVGEAKFLCSIKGKATMPVKNVSLRNIKVKTILDKPVSVENVQGLVNNA